jgi:hypothetical protein
MFGSLSEMELNHRIQVDGPGCAVYRNQLAVGDFFGGLFGLDYAGDAVLAGD